MSCKEGTRAIMVHAPLLVVTYTKRKASAEFQMSAPHPVTVNTPFVTPALPHAPTAPTSCVFQGKGTLTLAYALTWAELALSPAVLLKAVTT